MKTGWVKSLAMLVALMIALPAAAGVAGSIARGAAAAMHKRIGSKAFLKSEAARDASTSVRRLDAPATVYRYASGIHAAGEARNGIAPGRHMTGVGENSKMLNADRASRRYGIARPEVRETIVLPRGFPVRQSRVWSGARNATELTSPRRVPPGAIRKIKAVPAGDRP